MDDIKPKVDAKAYLFDIQNAVHLSFNCFLNQFRLLVRKYMNWNKFFIGTHRGEDRNEDESQSEEEEYTDSNGTVSTEKGSSFRGLRLQKLPHDRLSLRCIKSVFLTINAVTFLAGIVGIVTSGWSLIDDRIMSRLIGQRVLLLTLLFMGLIASLTSFLGIIALVKKRKMFLHVYVFCYGIFLCVIFVSAILCFWIFDYLTQKIHSDMLSAIESYRSSSSSREAWDNTHTYLKCCGIKSAKDWTTYYTDIPKSCCAKSIEECIRMTEFVAFKPGCLRNAVLLLKSHIQTISISALLIFLIVLLSFLFGLCIVSRTKAEQSNRGR